MASVAPLPPTTVGPDQVRPGQQLLPGYVVKLLKTVKIPFGTDRTMNGVDVDPTVALLSHIVDCLGALRDVNKVYRAKGSLASRSVGARAMFGFTAELGNLLLDSITFNPPSELKEAANFYSAVGASILNVFPEIAAQVTRSTGKMLIHHTALKASPVMSMDAIKMVTTAYPAGAWSPDSAGALPLHWITHNSSCNYELVSFLISANPKAPWVADVDGYLPLHWAVNQDLPNVDVVAALLTANPSAAAKACNKGSLPLHWCVNREAPLMGVVQALLQAHPDAVRTFCDEGWLPIHRCSDRSNPDLNVMKVLVELYPQGLQCRNSDGQLPLHRALDHQYPSEAVIEFMLKEYPGSAQVQDDEGYLPLHMALDCAAPSPLIVRLILDAYPEAAFQKTKDGLLPLHCAISCVNPIVEVIESLLQIFPESPEHLAMDIVPMDEYADPDSWEGDWKEKRWTPLSRAIDRRLDPCVALFKAALNDSLTKGRMGSPVKVISTFTAKRIMPGPMPPINAAIQEGSQEGSQAEASVGPEGASQTGSQTGAQQTRDGGENGQVVLPDDVQEEQEEVEIGANGLPVLKLTTEDDERANKYGYGRGYGPRDDDRGGREFNREKLEREERRRDRDRDSSRRHRRSPRDRERRRDKDRDRDRDREGRHRDKDRERHRRRHRSESREPGSGRHDRDRDREKRRDRRRKSGDDRGDSGGEGDLPKEGSNEAWKEASPSRNHDGDDEGNNQTPDRKSNNTKYFVAGAHKSPKEPPPPVIRDASDRALMASRESVKSRRGESGGGPGQGLEGMEEGSSEVMHKSSIDDMV